MVFVETDGESGRFAEWKTEYRHSHCPIAQQKLQSLLLTAKVEGG